MKPQLFSLNIGITGLFTFVYYWITTNTLPLRNKQFKFNYRVGFYSELLLIGRFFRWIGELVKGEWKRDNSTEWCEVVEKNRL